MCRHLLHGGLMKARRYRIYYYAGIAWLFGAITLLAATRRFTALEGLAWSTFIGGMIVLALTLFVEQIGFFDYLSTWDTQLRDDYVGPRLSSSACWGMTWLAFSREENGDPVLQQHKAAIRALNLLFGAGFVVAIMATFQT